jgi:Double zinc ribbon
MSRLREELRVIPRTAWILAPIAYLTAATLLFEVAVRRDPQMGQWPLAGQLAFCYGALLLLAAAILLVGYVYGDAKRRGMRYVMWTWLALLIPDGIGIILYFILRSQLPKPCPGCSAKLKSGYAFCPHCGTALQPRCPNCGQGVEPAWANCPHCGTKLPMQPLRAA